MPESSEKTGNGLYKREDANEIASYSTSKKLAISLGIAALFIAAIALSYPVIFLYFIGVVAIAVLIVVVGIVVRRIKETVDDMMFG